MNSSKRNTSPPMRRERSWSGRVTLTAPRRLPQSKQTQSELIQLRKQLLQAVNKEAYEEAARLRDRIRRLEES